MKPMIKYAGGKTGEIEVIKKFIPEYSGKYIEPFFWRRCFIFFT